MQLLEQIAYEKCEYVNEVSLFPNARAKKIWFSKKCKEGKDAINEANDLFRDKKYKEAKKMYMAGKDVFKEVREDIAKLKNGGGIAADAITTGLVAAASFNLTTLPLALVYSVWRMCSSAAISMQIGKILKLDENDVDILEKKKKDYNADEPSCVKMFLGVIDDIMYYCDEMIKKCSKGK